MATPKLSREVAEQALKALADNGGNQTKAAISMGIPRGTFDNRIRAARMYFGEVALGLAKTPPRAAAVPAPDAAPPPAPSAAEQDEMAQLRDRVFELTSQLKAAKDGTLNTEYVRRKIIGLSEAVDAAASPPWVLQKKSGDGLPGVPCAMWSDWHAGEVVSPEEIHGLNEFNMEVLRTRCRRLVERTIYLLRHHVVRPEYPGIVINLGGDMLSGDIHDELTATNEQALMPVLVELFGVIRWMLTTLADEFGYVYAPCVVGNHGRNTKKPRAKQRAYTNFDWLLYTFLQKSFEVDPLYKDSVKFFIPASTDARYDVAGRRYLLTHGDQGRGGDGIIGAIGPITRLNKAKQARNSNIGLAYDTMVIGHWHQLIPGSRLIVNGALKGYDEYAAVELNAPYEVPQQALWMTHPEHGITIHMPVILGQDMGRKDRGLDDSWVSWNIS